jgi:hypothetical protein
VLVDEAKWLQGSERAGAAYELLSKNGNKVVRLTVSLEVEDESTGEWKVISDMGHMADMGIEFDGFEDTDFHLPPAVESFEK